MKECGVEEMSKRERHTEILKDPISVLQKVIATLKQLGIQNFPKEDIDSVM